MILAFIIGAATGILSGCGIGGGSLLMLYLTAVAGMDQRMAAGINLLYFIACAPAALIKHHKNGLINRNAAFYCILWGVPVSAAASFLAGCLQLPLLRRLFGVFLLCVGLHELFAKSPKK